MDRTNNAFSILSFHWGKEHTNYPSIEHVRLSEIISNLKGNVLIHGHHPHVIQGTIVYNTALVAYSLGNCIFDDCTSMNGRLFLKQNSENRKSVILNVTIKDSTIRDYNTIGFREVDGKIELFDLSQEMTDIS
jgi:poly-gamma-glutamate synthesis protein (capsule biosynthesis protein)